MKTTASPLRRLLLVTLAALMSADSVGAQETMPRLDPGTRVRLRPMQRERDDIKGSVVSWTADSVAVGSRGGVHRVALLNLDRIQESTGRSAWRGAAKWGLIATAATAAVVIPMAFLESAQGAAEGSTVSPTFAMAALGVVFVIPTATITGAIVGGERWRTSWERR